MGYTERDIQNIYLVLEHYCERVRQLEEQLSQLKGNKGCVVVNLKPNINNKV